MEDNSISEKLVGTDDMLRARWEQQEESPVMLDFQTVIALPPVQGAQVIRSYATQLSRKQYQYLVYLFVRFLCHSLPYHSTNKFGAVPKKQTDKSELHLQSWIDKLMFGQNSKTIMEQVERDSTLDSGVCGMTMKSKDVVYYCRTCGDDETCIQCQACFHDSDHTGHDVRMTQSGGGICDCGNPSAWSLAGSCTKHRGPDSGSVLARNLRKHVSVQDIETFVLPVLYAACDCIATTVSAPPNKRSSLMLEPVKKTLALHTPTLPANHYLSNLLVTRAFTEEETVMTYSHDDMVRFLANYGLIADGYELQGQRKFIMGSPNHMLRAVDLGLDLTESSPTQCFSNRQTEIQHLDSILDNLGNTSCSMMNAVGTPLGYPTMVESRVRMFGLVQHDDNVSSYDHVKMSLLNEPRLRLESEQDTQTLASRIDMVGHALILASTDFQKVCATHKALSECKLLVSIYEIGNPARLPLMGVGVKSLEDMDSVLTNFPSEDTPVIPSSTSKREMTPELQEYAECNQIPIPVGHLGSLRFYDGEPMPCPGSFMMLHDLRVVSLQHIVRKLCDQSHDMKQQIALVLSSGLGRVFPHTKGQDMVELTLNSESLLTYPTPDMVQLYMAEGVQLNNELPLAYRLAGLEQGGMSDDEPGLQMGTDSFSSEAVQPLLREMFERGEKNPLARMAPALPSCPEPQKEAYASCVVGQRVPNDKTTLAEEVCTDLTLNPRSVSLPTPLVSLFRPLPLSNQFHYNQSPLMAPLSVHQDNREFPPEQGLVLFDLWYKSNLSQTKLVANAMHAVASQLFSTTVFKRLYTSSFTRYSAHTCLRLDSSHEDGKELMVYSDVQAITEARYAILGQLHHKTLNVLLDSMQIVHEAIRKHMCGNRAMFAPSNFISNIMRCNTVGALIITSDLYAIRRWAQLNIMMQRAHVTHRHFLARETYSNRLFFTILNRSIDSNLNEAFVKSLGRVWEDKFLFNAVQSVEHMVDYTALDRALTDLDLRHPRLEFLAVNSRRQPPYPKLSEGDFTQLYKGTSQDYALYCQMEFMLRDPVVCRDLLYTVDLMTREQYGNGMHLKIEQFVPNDSFVKPISRKLHLSEYEVYEQLEAAPRKLIRSALLLHLRKRQSANRVLSVVFEVMNEEWESYAASIRGNRFFSARGELSNTKSPGSVPVMQPEVLKKTFLRALVQVDGQNEDFTLTNPETIACNSLRYSELPLQYGSAHDDDSTTLYHTQENMLSFIWRMLLQWGISVDELSPHPKNSDPIVFDRFGYYNSSCLVGPTVVERNNFLAKVHAAACNIFAYTISASNHLYARTGEWVYEEVLIAIRLQAQFLRDAIHHFQLMASFGVDAAFMGLMSKCHMSMLLGLIAGTSWPVYCHHSVVRGDVCDYVQVTVSDSIVQRLTACIRCVPEHRFSGFVELLMQCLLLFLTDRIDITPSSSLLRCRDHAIHLLTYKPLSFAAVTKDMHDKFDAATIHRSVTEISTPHATQYAAPGGVSPGSSTESAKNSVYTVKPYYIELFQPTLICDSLRTQGSQGLNNITVMWKPKHERRAKIWAACFNNPASTTSSTTACYRPQGSSATTTTAASVATGIASYTEGAQLASSVTNHIMLPLTSAQQEVYSANVNSSPFPVTPPLMTTFSSYSSLEDGFYSVIAWRFVQMIMQTVCMNTQTSPSLLKLLGLVEKYPKWPGQTACKAGESVNMIVHHDCTEDKVLSGKLDQSTVSGTLYLGRSKVSDDLDWKKVGYTPEGQAVMHKDYKLQSNDQLHAHALNYIAYAMNDSVGELYPASSYEVDGSMLRSVYGDDELGICPPVTSSILIDSPRQTSTLPMLAGCNVFCRSSAAAQNAFLQSFIARKQDEESVPTKFNLQVYEQDKVSGFQQFFDYRTLLGAPCVPVVTLDGLFKEPRPPFVDFSIPRHHNPIHMAMVLGRLVAPLEAAFSCSEPSIWKTAWTYFPVFSLGFSEAFSLSQSQAVLQKVVSVHSTSGLAVQGNNQLNEFTYISRAHTLLGTLCLALGPSNKERITSLRGVVDETLGNMYRTSARNTLSKVLILTRRFQLARARALYATIGSSAPLQCPSLNETLFFLNLCYGCDYPCSEVQSVAVTNPPSLLQMLPAVIQDSSLAVSPALFMLSLIGPLEAKILNTVLPYIADDLELQFLAGISIVHEATQQAEASVATSEKIDPKELMRRKKEEMMAKMKAKQHSFIPVTVSGPTDTEQLESVPEHVREAADKNTARENNGGTLQKCVICMNGAQLTEEKTQELYNASAELMEAAVQGCIYGQVGWYLAENNDTLSEFLRACKVLFVEYEQLAAKNLEIPGGEAVHEFIKTVSSNTSDSTDFMDSLQTSFFFHNVFEAIFGTSTLPCSMKSISPEYKALDLKVRKLLLYKLHIESMGVLCASVACNNEKLLDYTGTLFTGRSFTNNAALVLKDKSNVDEACRLQIEEFSSNINDSLAITGPQIKSTESVHVVESNITRSDGTSVTGLNNLIRPIVTELSSNQVSRVFQDLHAYEPDAFREIVNQMSEDDEEDMEMYSVMDAFEGEEDEDDDILDVDDESQQYSMESVVTDEDEDDEDDEDDVELDGIFDIDDDDMFDSSSFDDEDDDDDDDSGNDDEDDETLAKGRKNLSILPNIDPFKHIVDIEVPLKRQETQLREGKCPNVSAEMAHFARIVMHQDVAPRIGDEPKIHNDMLLSGVLHNSPSNTETEGPSAVNLVSAWRKLHFFGLKCQEAFSEGVITQENVYSNVNGDLFHHIADKESQTAPKYRAAEPFSGKLLKEVVHGHAVNPSLVHAGAPLLVNYMDALGTLRQAMDHNEKLGPVRHMLGIFKVTSKFYYSLYRMGAGHSVFIHLLRKQSYVSMIVGHELIRSSLSDIPLSNLTTTQSAALGLWKSLFARETTMYSRVAVQARDPQFYLQEQLHSLMLGCVDAPRVLELQHSEIVVDGATSTAVSKAGSVPLRNTPDSNSSSEMISHLAASYAQSTRVCEASGYEMPLVARSHAKPVLSSCGHHVHLHCRRSQMADASNYLDMLQDLDSTSENQEQQYYQSYQVFSEALIAAVNETAHSFPASHDQDVLQSLCGIVDSALLKKMLEIKTKVFQLMSLPIQSVLQALPVVNSTDMEPFYCIPVRVSYDSWFARLHSVLLPSLQADLSYSSSNRGSNMWESVVCPMCRSFSDMWLPVPSFKDNILKRVDGVPEMASDDTAAVDIHAALLNINMTKSVYMQPSYKANSMMVPSVLKLSRAFQAYFDTLLPFRAPNSSPATVIPNTLVQSSAATAVSETNDRFLRLTDNQLKIDISTLIHILRSTIVSLEQGQRSITNTKIAKLTKAGLFQQVKVSVPQRHLDVLGLLAGNVSACLANYEDCAPVSDSVQTGGVTGLLRQETWGRVAQTLNPVIEAHTCPLPLHTDIVELYITALCAHTRSMTSGNPVDHVVMQQEQQWLLQQCVSLIHAQALFSALFVLEQDVHAMHFNGVLRQVEDALNQENNSSCPVCLTTFEEKNGNCAKCTTFHAFLLSAVESIRQHTPFNNKASVFDGNTSLFYSPVQKSVAMFTPKSKDLLDPSVWFQSAVKDAVVLSGGSEDYKVVSSHRRSLSTSQIVGMQYLSSVTIALRQLQVFNEAMQSNPVNRTYKSTLTNGMPSNLSIRDYTRVTYADESSIQDSGAWQETLVQYQGYMQELQVHADDIVAITQQWCRSIDMFEVRVSASSVAGANGESISAISPDVFKVSPDSLISNILVSTAVAPHSILQDVCKVDNLLCGHYDLPVLKMTQRKLQVTFSNNNNSSSIPYFSAAPLAITHMRTLPTPRFLLPPSLIPLPKLYSDLLLASSLSKISKCVVCKESFGVSALCLCCGEMVAYNGIYVACSACHPQQAFNSFVLEHDFVSALPNSALPSELPAASILQHSLGSDQPASIVSQNVQQTPFRAVAKISKLVEVTDALNKMHPLAEHTIICSGSPKAPGIFLRTRTCDVVAVVNKKFLSLPCPYVDQFGEQIEGSLSRGTALLFLDQAKYKALTETYFLLTKALGQQVLSVSRDFDAPVQF